MKVAAGNDVIVTGVVACTAAQPPEEGIVYVTVYAPAALVPGVIAPVEALMDNPKGKDVKVPPAVPVSVTF